MVGRTDNAVLFREKVRKVLSKLLTAGNCYIVSMVAGSADGCAVPAGEEMEEIGGVAVYFVQEDCTITLAKTVKKNRFMIKRRTEQTAMIVLDLKEIKCIQLNSAIRLTFRRLRGNEP